MKSRNFISLNFLLKHEDICDLDNVLHLEKLIGQHSPRDITEVVSTSNWYEMAPEITVFDILSNEISDMQLRSAIIGKLSQVFGLYATDDIDNNNATECALKKYDDSFYYSIISPVDTIKDLEECETVSTSDDYNRIHEKHLSLCPESNEDYALRCVYIFDKVKFSDNFSNTLSTLGNNQGITDFSIPITKALTILNRLDPAIRNIQEAMHWIHTESGFECSPQGANKGHLFPTIQLDDGTERQINCEFHMKINASNLADNLKHHSRIYFGLMPVGQCKHTYLLHCGEHL
ncbi:hypothetical protein ACU6ZN_18045 [Klebsiella aerogenes]